MKASLIADAVLNTLFGKGTFAETLLTLAEESRDQKFTQRKAPHAYPAPMKRPRRRPSSVLAPRLFKGHRP